MTRRDTEVHLWVWNDVWRWYNTNATRNKARGVMGSREGAHLYTHVAEIKREKKQIVTEGHRCDGTGILVTPGVLMDADGCVGVGGTQGKMRRDTGGRGLAYMGHHVNTGTTE